MPYQINLKQDCYMCGITFLEINNRSLDIFDCVNLNPGDGAVDNCYTICPDCRIKLLNFIHLERQKYGLPKERIIND